MQILFFTRKCYPSKGGVQTHVMEISKQLVKKGYTVRIITESDSFEDKRKAKKSSSAEIDGIQIEYLYLGNDSALKKFRAWIHLLKYISVIRGIDIIHFHDVFYMYLPFRFFFFNKKVFTTFHGYETHFPPKKGAIIMRKISEKLSTRTICVGDFIRKWYYTRPDIVTYGALNQGIITTKKTENTIIFVGRIEKDTGADIYAKALEKIMKNKGITFLAVGEGSKRKLFEKYGKVTGFLENIRDEISQADIVFASSYLVMLEALYQKKLVIAVYDNPLKEDYLKLSPFGKFVLVCQSPEEITEHVLSFYSGRKTYKKIRDEAFAWASQQTWERLANVYLKLWKN